MQTKSYKQIDLISESPSYKLLSFGFKSLLIISDSEKGWLLGCCPSAS